MKIGWLEVAGLAHPDNGLAMVVIGALVVVVVVVALVVVVVVGAFVVVALVVVVVGALVVVVVVVALVVVVVVGALVAVVVVVALVVVVVVGALVVVALVVVVVVGALVVVALVVALVVVVVVGALVVVVAVSAKRLSATAEALAISSVDEQSHATSEPVQLRVAESQELPSPTRLSHNRVDDAEQGSCCVRAGTDRLINAILNIPPTIFSKMEIVNEVNFKSIIRSCLTVATGKLSVVARGDPYIVFVDDTAVHVWFQRPDVMNFGDRSPSQSLVDTPGPVSFKSISVWRFDGIPRFKYGLSFRLDRKGDFFDSIVLLPFGHTQSKDRILSTEVFKSDRLLIACILSTKRLLLATESSQSENCSFAPISFNIDHLFPLPSLKSPATVHISSNGSRVFVTDNTSDLIIEFRFDYSLVSPQRGCPDFHLIHWYLESAVAIGSNTRVSLINPDNSSPSGTPYIQIIGTCSNGDSQGIVRLVNQRRWIPSPITPPCSISVAHNCVLVNTPNYLKLVDLSKGPDFPLTIRPPATNTTLAPSGAYFCLYAGIISAFRVDTDNTGESRIVVPLSVSGLTECVDSFAIDPVVGNFAVIIVQGDPTVLHVYELSTIQKNHVQFTFKSQHSLPSSVSCLSINQYGEWVCISDSGILCSNCEPIRKATTAHAHVKTFDNVALCDDWFALIYKEEATNHTCLELRSLYDSAKICSQFSVVAETKIAQLRFESVTLNGRKQKLLYGISGHLVIMGRDFQKGTTWTLERLDEQHRHSLCVLKETDRTEGPYEAVFVDTTAPYRVYESSIESLPLNAVSAMMHSFAACIDADEFRSEISWAILPDTLRSKVEPLIALEKFPDTVRSTDSACRRYLIEYAFSQEFPTVVRLSTEALAWASVSEMQAYIVQQVVNPQTVCWGNLANTGIGFWCTEIGLSKGIVESVQKNALSEYMKSKDPQILEDKVAMWLCLLGKQQLLSTLYKQYGNSCASPVHVKIGQFLATDFSDPENANKAKKNAFELLRQKRYWLAVSMFILGGSFREALDLCCRQLDDVQLALFVAKILKVVRNRVDGDECIDPLIDYLWTERIIPYADAWTSLVYTCSKLDLDGALRVFDKNDSQSVGDHNVMCRIFAIPRFDLTRHSASRLVMSVQERMRRLNRHCGYDIPVVPVEDISAAYLSRGLSGLAQTIMRGAHSPNAYLTRAIELEISH